MRRCAHLDCSPHALLQAHLRFVSQYPTGLLDVVPTVCARVCYAVTRKGWLAPRQPTPPLCQCRDCETDQLGHHEGFARGICVGREQSPQSPREIPKVDRLAIGDKEDLAGDLEWISAGTRERCFGELVETRANDGVLGLAGAFEGSDDSVRPLRTVDVGSQWPCKRCRHPMLARGQVNGR